MSFAQRPEPGTWLLSSKEMDQVTAHMLGQVRVDRSHDVPYVAGYSTDGRTVYIDRMMPRGFRYAGREVLTDKYLVLHETIEKSLEDGTRNGGLRLHYLLAHQIALRAERDAVIADKVPWGVYDHFCQIQIKAIGGRKDYPNCPRDLDLEPYRDEVDRATLRRMRFTDVQPLPTAPATDATAPAAAD